MRRAILASVLAFGCVSVLWAQNLDLSQAKMLVQFSRAMKAERARNTIDFNVSGEREYVVDVEANGFKPTVKITRGDAAGQTISTGRKLNQHHIRAELVDVPTGTLQVTV